MEEQEDSEKRHVPLFPSSNLPFLLPRFRVASKNKFLY